MQQEDHYQAASLLCPSPAVLALCSLHLHSAAERRGQESSSEAMRCLGLPPPLPAGCWVGPGDAWPGGEPFPWTSSCCGLPSHLASLKWHRNQQGLEQTICGSISPQLFYRWYENPGLRKFVRHQMHLMTHSTLPAILPCTTICLTLVSHSECHEIFYVLIVFHCSEEGNIVIKRHGTCRLVGDMKLNWVLWGSKRQEFMQGLYWNLVLGSCCCFTWKWPRDHLVMHRIFNNNNLSGMFI